jgi:hypothetical protein
VVDDCDYKGKLWVDIFIERNNQWETSSADQAYDGDLINSQESSSEDIRIRFNIEDRVIYLHVALYLSKRKCNWYLLQVNNFINRLPSIL